MIPLFNKTIDADKITKNNNFSTFFQNQLVQPIFNQNYHDSEHDKFPSKTNWGLFDNKESIHLVHH